MAKLFAKSGDHDQTMLSVVSDLGLHCLQIHLIGVSRLQRVNLYSFNLDTMFLGSTFKPSYSLYPLIMKNLIKRLSESPDQTAQPFSPNTALLTTVIQHSLLKYVL